MSSSDDSNSSSPKFAPAHTRTLSSSHTRTLSSTHNIVVSMPAPVQTTGIGAHTQQLTSIPSELPQLMVTTPTTVYSAYTAHSSSSSFGTPYSPPMQVPDAPVPAIPEEYRQQPTIESASVKPASPKQATPPPASPAAIMLPSLVITNSTPPPQQARFASPMTANPNMPVLPKIATPGSANVARKPPAAINTEAAAVARVKAGARSHSPPSKPPGNFTPTKPYGPGSISTMSPVAAARSFNARRGAPQQPSHRAAGSKESVDSPTVATASLYSSMKTQDKADISLSDRVVNKETLFDLDVDAEATGEDAKEIPLEDLMKDELPEYIQVYLTPHPDREQGSWGEHEKKHIKGTLESVDEKAEIKDKEKEEYERRAAKWGDIEATLPAYKSTASLQRAVPFGRGTPSPPPGSPPAKNKKKPILRRCIPQKPTARILCIVILILMLLIIPLVSFGVVYSLQRKGHHDDPVAVQAAQNAPASGSQAAGSIDPNNPGADGEAGPPPVVAPMNNNP